MFPGLSSITCIDPISIWTLQSNPSDIRRNSLSSRKSRDDQNGPSAEAGSRALDLSLPCGRAQFPLIETPQS